ncbi:hypothetical protein, partial [Paracraurococcus lichenis]
LGRRVAELRAARDAVDTAIRLFDPARLPHKIKPRLRRLRPPMFRHGECSRAILSMLRIAEEPLTARAVVERLEVEYHLDLSEPARRAELVNKVQVTLRRYAKGGLICEERGLEVVWRLAR